MTQNHIFGTKTDSLASGKSNVNFDAPALDIYLVGVIVKRASILCSDRGLTIDFMTAQMDVLACHCNGCPLELKDFYISDNASFMADFQGICNNINRHTGKLLHNFKPKFAKSNYNKLN